MKADDPDPDRKTIRVTGIYSCTGTIFSLFPFPLIPRKPMGGDECSASIVRGMLHSVPYERRGAYPTKTGRGLRSAFRRQKPRAVYVRKETEPISAAGRDPAPPLFFLPFDAAWLHPPRGR